MSRARDFANLAGSADAGGLTGRNLIINGAMQVAQRGTSHTLSAGTGSYTLDRVRSQSNGGGITVSQETNAISGIQTEKMCRYTGAASVTGVYYVYRVESKDAVQLNGNSVTFSIYIENNSGASISPTIDYYHPTASDNFSGLTTIASGVALGTIANGASARLTATTDLSGTTITNGLMFQVNFGSALTSGTIDFTGVQLELGETATPFEHRSYGDELARCQRYFYSKTREGTGDNHLVGMSYWSSTTSNECILQHPVHMRATPTISVDTIGDFYGLIPQQAWQQASSFSLDEGGPNTTKVTFTCSSNGSFSTDGRRASCIGIRGNSGRLKVDAEL